MNRDQALSKIKKCLALGGSANPHEAANAMRQAQKLMAEHLVSADDIALSDVSMKSCSARTNSMPRWEAKLSSVIADAFGCDVIWTRKARVLQYKVAYSRAVIFYGVGTAPEIAGYAWDVLSRQCAKGRLAHIRAQPPRCKPITLTARGDQYALGWVFGVMEKLEAFAAPQKATLLLEQFKEATWPDSTTGNPKDRTKGRNVSTNDFYTGVRHGQSASLNHGVSGAARQELLT